MTPLTSSLQGLGVALITPFNAQGQIDFPGLQNIVGRQTGGGTSFLVVLGTTGETPTLTAEEQRRVVDFVLEVTERKLPVVVGVTGNSTMELCDRIQHAGKTTASMRSLVATPSYNKPNQEGIVKHLRGRGRRGPSSCDVVQRAWTNGQQFDSGHHLLWLATPTSSASKRPVAIWLKLERSWQADQKALGCGQGTMHSPCPRWPWGRMVWFLCLATCCLHPCRMIQQAAFGQMQDAQFSPCAAQPIDETPFRGRQSSGIKAAMGHLALCEPHVRLPLTPASELYKALPKSST